ncbi:MAG: ROK family protein [Planctomycetota bacterium]
MGFDLGGTKMMAVAFDDTFKMLGRKRKRTQGEKGAEVGKDRILRTIEKTLEDAQIDSSQLGGIGVGVPGPVDPEEGVVLEAVNLGWKNVPLQKILEEAFDCPARILNDVDAGVFGENQLGAAKEARTVLGIFPGTGIGGGCVYDGEIVRGKHISAMEIGHMEVAHNGNFCGCGRRGCLEAEASRLAISAEVAKAAYRGEAPYLRDRIGTDISDIRSGALADAVDHGDQVVEQIIRTAARKIGIAVANVVHLIAPDTVVLGGGLVEAMPHLFVEEVAQAANNRVMPSFLGSFDVVPAELGDYSTVKGTAAWTRSVIVGKGD